MRLKEMAERTPATRDRYVDFLRAFSIATVVIGHWFIAIVLRHGGRISVISAIGATSGLWLGTWFLQVMPLFFFVGGFSNYVTYEALQRRGDTYLSFMRTRLARLMKPTVVFFGLWAIVQIVLHAVDTGGEGFLRLSFLPFGPLWFLFVYVAVIAATPVALRAHRRLGAVVPVALVAGVAIADVLRFAAGVPLVGWVNLALVWLFAHQLGFFYADGSLVRVGRNVHMAMAGVGLAGLIVLTNIGVYPRSMIGTDVERISNMNPPTACLIALTLWLVGLAMLAREPVRRWLAGTRPWMAVIAANGVIMTVFLWHLTAYLLAILVLWPVGIGHQTDTTAWWWAFRPIWIAVPAVILAAFVALFGRFERAGRAGASEPDPPPSRTQS
jgi:hypothetical protein